MTDTTTTSESTDPVGEPTAPEAIVPRAERDARGRFLPGWVGGPGRPRGVDNFRTMIAEAQGEVSITDAIQRVYRAMLAAAEGGDVAAATLVLNRLLGPVRAEVDVAVTPVFDPLDDIAMTRQIASIFAVVAARADAAKKAQP